MLLKSINKNLNNESFRIQNKFLEFPYINVIPFSLSISIDPILLFKYYPNLGNLIKTKIY